MTLFSNTELLERVRTGNKVLMDAFLTGCSGASFDKARAKLCALCDRLERLGYTGCLYDDGRSCFPDDDYICLVCPCKSTGKRS